MATYAESPPCQNALPKGMTESVLNYAFQKPNTQSKSRKE